MSDLVKSASYISRQVCSGVSEGRSHEVVKDLFTLLIKLTHKSPKDIYMVWDRGANAVACIDHARYGRIYPK